MSFLHRPQGSLIRKALFQVHLWMGLLVALYVILIGVTGAALVFRPQFQKVTFPEFFSVARDGQPDASASKIIDTLLDRYPGYALAGIDYPTHRRETYLAYLTKGNDLRTVFSHPVSGEIIGELPKTSWITRMQDLHFDLLGGRTGRTVNGIAAFALIAMFVTGAVVWWPGLDRWRQSMMVNFRAGWKRMNWDLHSATGFWLFGLLMLWAVTGVEFAFRQPFRNFVNAISPLTVVRPPRSVVRPERLPTADATALVAKSVTLVPGAKLGRVVLPSSPTAATLVLMAYNTHGDFDTSDEVNLYYDQYTGELLRKQITSQEPQTAGDVVMRWIGPLHVGSFGGTGLMGTAVQTLWMILALSFPLLAVTGAIMWWNRSGRGWFSKRARRI